MYVSLLQVRNETLDQILQREIISYNIKLSLFDIVVLAVIRFTILLLFYALLYINNWSVIAVSMSVLFLFALGQVCISLEWFGG